MVFVVRGGVMKMMIRPVDCEGLKGGDGEEGGRWGQYGSRFWAWGVQDHG